MKVTKQVTTMKRMFTLLGVALAASGGAQADQWAEVMNLSKTAGHCAMVSRLFTFQDVKKIAGGEEFIMRFLTTEAAHAGFSTSSELVQYRLAVCAPRARARGATTPS
jgi:hypothetical protein